LWKRGFTEANGWADVIYLPTNGAIAGWNSAAARAWVEKEVRRPVITCDDFMMPYAVLGLTKVAREQGDLAARIALSILAGKRPADFMVSANVQGRIFFNAALAEKINFKPDPELQKMIGKQ